MGRSDWCPTCRRNLLEGRYDRLPPGTVSQAELDSLGAGDAVAAVAATQAERRAETAPADAAADGGDAPDLAESEASGDEASTNADMRSCRALPLGFLALNV